MSCRVYRYGLLPPTENMDLVRQQLVLAHRYRNVLIEIERGRRAVVRGIMTSSSGTIGQLEEQLKVAEEEIVQAIKEVSLARAAKRERAVTQELRDAITRARLKKREILTAGKQRQREALDVATVRARPAGRGRPRKQRQREALDVATSRAPWSSAWCCSKQRQREALDVATERLVCAAASSPLRSRGSARPWTSRPDDVAPYYPFVEQGAEAARGLGHRDEHFGEIDRIERG